MDDSRVYETNKRWGELMWETSTMTNDREIYMCDWNGTKSSSPRMLTMTQWENLPDTMIFKGKPDYISNPYWFRMITPIFGVKAPSFRVRSRNLD